MTKVWADYIRLNVHFERNKRRYGADTSPHNQALCSNLWWIFAESPPQNTQIQYIHWPPSLSKILQPVLLKASRPWPPVLPPHRHSLAGSWTQLRECHPHHHTKCHPRHTHVTVSQMQKKILFNIFIWNLLSCCLALNIVWSMISGLIRDLMVSPDHWDPHLGYKADNLIQNHDPWWCGYKIAWF